MHRQLLEKLSTPFLVALFFKNLTTFKVSDRSDALQLLQVMVEIIKSEMHQSSIDDEPNTIGSIALFYKWQNDFRVIFDAIVTPDPPYRVTSVSFGLAELIHPTIAVDNMSIYGTVQNTISKAAPSDISSNNDILSVASQATKKSIAVSDDKSKLSLRTIDKTRDLHNLFTMISERHVTYPVVKEGARTSSPVITEATSKRCDFDFVSDGDD